jgi:transposase
LGEHLPCPGFGGRSASAGVDR